MTFNIRGLAFTVLLAGLSALPPLAIDMALPTLSTVQSGFGATQTEAAATIAIFLVGFSTAPIVIGPLTDRYGRRPAMLLGLVAFTLCGLGCAFAPSIGSLLALRLLQGAGAGAVGVLPRAIVRDLFEGDEARLRLSAVSLVSGVAPVVAPTLGALVLMVAPWRMVYGALAAIGVVLFAGAWALYAESLPPARRQSVAPAAILRNYKRALTTPVSIGFSLINAVVFAGMFAFINVSPLLFIGSWGFSKTAFAAIFATVALGVGFGSWANGWLVRHGVGPRGAMDIALTANCVASFALIVATLAGVAGPAVVIGFSTLYVATFGLIMPNAGHEAVHPLPEIAGVASAIMLAAQMLFGAFGGALGASLYRGGSPLAIGEMMGACALAASALYAFWLRARIDD